MRQNWSQDYSGGMLTVVGVKTLMTFTLITSRQYKLPREQTSPQNETTLMELTSVMNSFKTELSQKKTPVGGTPVCRYSPSNYPQC